MFEKVVKILEISKEKKVDIGVAYDMARTENKDTNFDDAYKALRENFDTVTRLWKAGKSDELKKYCETLGVVENEQNTN